MKDNMQKVHADLVDEAFDELDDLLVDQISDPRFRASLHDTQERSGLIDALVRMRKEFGLTQAVIAERMGTTQSAVSDFENGSSDYFVSTAQRYARAATGRVRLVLEIPCDGPWGDVTRQYQKSAPRIRCTVQPAGVKSPWQRASAPAR